MDDSYCLKVKRLFYRLKWLFVKKNLMEMEPYFNFLQTPDFIDTALSLFDKYDCQKEMNPLAKSDLKHDLSNLMQFALDAEKLPEVSKGC